MPELKGYPVIYPPDGLYYVYSKECGWFWRQHEKDAGGGGGVIDCDVLGPPSAADNDSAMDSRIWKITTVTPANEKHRNPRVTLQNVRAQQRSFDVGGYVTKKKGKLIQTGQKTAWKLIGDCTKPFSYKVVTDDRLLSINAPTPSILNPTTHLSVAFHITDAYDGKVFDPQWWYFIPVNQIDQFLAINDIKRAAK